MRACISGFGRMGQRHAAALRQLGIELAGVHDIRLQAVTGPNSSIGENPRSYEDAKTMLRDCKPDILIIATTAPSHFALLEVAAMESVSYVFIEKPPFCSINEARLALTAHSNATNIFFNFCARRHSLYQLLTRIESSKLHGALRSSNITAHNVGLAMNGCHPLDFHMIMTQSEPQQTYFLSDGITTRNPRGDEYIDMSGTGTFKFMDGSRLNFDIGAEIRSGYVSTWVFEDLTLTADQVSGVAIASSSRPLENELIQDLRYDPVSGLITLPPIDVVQLSAETLGAALSGKSVPNLWDASRVTSALVSAFISANANGKWVAVDDQLPPNNHFNWA